MSLVYAGLDAVVKVDEDFSQAGAENVRLDNGPRWRPRHLPSIERKQKRTDLINTVFPPTILVPANGLIVLAVPQHSLVSSTCSVSIVTVFPAWWSMIV
jgi:hypothetical protein